MASKPETLYIARVHKKLPLVVWREKMANPFRKGRPDVDYEGTKATIHVEYKWYPKRPEIMDLGNTKLKVACTTLQKEWLKRSHKNGRTVAVIAGTPEGGAIFPGDSWDALVAAADYELRTPQEVADWIYRNTMKK